MTHTRRVAFSVGHNPRRPGVTRADGTTEHDFNDELATQLWQALHVHGISAQPFKRSNDLGYTSGMRALCDEINAWHPDIVISLHSNGIGDPNVSGSEALHWPGDASEVDRPTVTASGHSRERDLARVLSTAYATVLGIRDRGTIAQSNSWNRGSSPQLYHPTKTWRGKPKPIPSGPPLWILTMIEADCAIGESHYMSNDADHALALAALANGTMAAQLADAIAAHLHEAPADG